MTKKIDRRANAAFLRETDPELHPLSVRGTDGSIPSLWRQIVNCSCTLSDPMTT